MNKPKLVASGLLLAVFVAGLIGGGAVSALADRSDPVDPLILGSQSLTVSRFAAYATRMSPRA